MQPPDSTDLSGVAKEIRKKILKSIFQAQSGHVGSSLSAVEILAALFFKEMKLDRPFRDRFILSKGHAAPCLYAVLSMLGHISDELLGTLRNMGSPLQGHPVKGMLPFIDASTGSLGQGLSMGIGYALASRFLNEKRRVYVVLGDGELQEGQNWEAAMSAAKFQLHNLVAILDFNKYQNEGYVDDTMPVGPLKEKWEAFGWDVQEIDGHNIEALLNAFCRVRENNRPSIIIAHTIKGKGVSCIEGSPDTYCVPPNSAQYAFAMDELNAV